MDVPILFSGENPGTRRSFVKGDFPAADLMSHKDVILIAARNFSAQRKF